jgi:hypothetical protein
LSHSGGGEGAGVVLILLEEDSLFSLQLFPKIICIYSRKNDKSPILDEGGIMNKFDQNVIIAHCGIVCSKCGAFLKGKCKGCHSAKPMFKNCPIKKCNLENELVTCADCQEFQDLKRCKKLNSFISKIFGLLFRSNRIGNLVRIREIGLDAYKKQV